MKGNKMKTMNEEQINMRIEKVQKTICGSDMEALEKKNKELLDLFQQLSFIKKQKSINANVKKSKNYNHLAGNLMMKLLASDVKLQLLFNVVNIDGVRKVNLNSIRDELKNLYPVNKDSVRDLNVLLKKYKVQIEDKPLTVNPYTLRPIKSNDIYMPKGYRQHSKPITIYNVKHLPTVI